MRDIMKRAFYKMGTETFKIEQLSDAIKRTRHSTGKLLSSWTRKGFTSRLSVGTYRFNDSVIDLYSIDNLPKRESGESGTVVVKIPVPITMATARKFYVNGGCSVPEMAILWGCSKYAVRKHLADFIIPVKGRIEQKILMVTRKTTYIPMHPMSISEVKEEPKSSYTDKLDLDKDTLIKVAQFVLGDKFEAWKQAVLEEAWKNQGVMEHAVRTLFHDMVNKNVASR